MTYAPGVGASETPDELSALRATNRDRGALFASMFEGHRPRLERMVYFRMDPRVRARLSASDVLQDVFVEASGRLDRYVDDGRMPLFLWLRFLTGQAVAAAYRHHIGVKMRDARRQVPLQDRARLGASTVAMADALIARGTTPTRGAANEELRERMASALDAMSESDREILVLRHFEELTNGEAAQELGIDISAASKRFIRALDRLRAILHAENFEVDFS